MHRVEQLYRAFQRDVYLYLLSLTGDPTQAEDLTSETFLQALCAIGRFRGDSSVKTWLLGIARHLWLRQLRSPPPLTGDSALLGAYLCGPGPESQLIARQAVDRIAQLLSEKGEGPRRTIYLRALGHSYDEIAVMLHISPKSARVIEFRTKKWLREQLQKEGYL